MGRPVVVLSRDRWAFAFHVAPTRTGRAHLDDYFGGVCSASRWLLVPVRVPNVAFERQDCPLGFFFTL